MSGTITALKIQKRDKERVNVFLDDEFAFAVTAIVAAELRKGQYLNDVEIEALKQGAERDKAYNRAIRFLSFRPRSQAEVERYLRDKGYAEEVVADTVSRLLDQRYLDDEAFARFWVDNRERFRPRGQRALRYELRQKGIADGVIDIVLADLGEADLAWTAIEGKLHHWQNLTKEALQKKVMGFLSRRGFGYEIANQTFKRACSVLGMSEEAGSIDTSWLTE